MKLSRISPILLLSLTLLCACSGKEGGKTDEKDAKPVVKVETVQERLVDQLGNYTATVEAQAVNNISAAMSDRKSVV